VEAVFLEELRRRVEASMVELRVPGVAVGILAHGEETVETFGVTSIEHPLPVDEHTLIQIGSTTKTFTATLLMQEVETGRLDLDAPVRQYLPELRLKRDGWSDGLLVRHLLTHSGGFDGDWFLVHPRDQDERLASVASALHEAPSRTPPGAAYAYSNAGFAIAGRLVEVLAGDDAPFEELVAERIFQPLGMTHSVLRSHDLLLHSYAAGHLVRDGVIEVARPWQLVRSAAAHGGIAAGVRDQLRWLRFQLGDGTGLDAAGIQSRLLDASTLRAMQTRQIEGGSNCDAVGFAWMLEAIGSTDVWRHGGETNGQMCGFRFVPAHDFGITVMTNSSSGIRLHEELIEWVLAERLGVSTPPPPHLDRPAPVESLGRYCGSIKDVILSDRGGELWIEVQGHQREGRPPPPIVPPARARFVTPRTFVPVDGPLVGRGDLIEAIPGAGSGPWLRWDGRLLPRDSAATTK